DDKFGLKHILEQRGKQWTEQKALKFVSHLGEIINEATITKGRDGTIELITPKSTAILSQKGDNKFILTAFRDSGNKKRLESGSYQTFHDDNFTDKSVSVRKETDILSSNHNKEGNGKTPDDAIFTAKQPLANPSD
ncbi:MULTISPECIES: hypothetical protein, partial [unclassified Campylobacter]|uniref:hypothetical protein n=1 Tax=unclassified Campylobacter TaxID=2593542 RepID=UPI003D354A39